MAWAIFLLAGLFSHLAAQKYEYTSKEWKRLVYESKYSFFKTPEAVQIVQNVLDYQRDTGGWPKNLAIHRPLTEKEREDVLAEKSRRYDSTIDNGATVQEMTFLAKIYEATSDCKYLDAFERGLEFLLSGQYKNGGWPQFWPANRDYQVHITYNDDAMVHVMRLLRDVRDGKGVFSLVSDPVMIQRVATAFDNGMDCILKTQIRIDDTPTIWCQQYDRHSLKPARARAYELPSFCTQESAEIVKLLMETKDPDEDIKTSIRCAMDWFDAHKLTGIKINSYINNEGKKDIQVMPDSTATPVWARFYDLKTGKPFFCDRDGIKKKNLHEIGYERRNGYKWYNYAPASLLERYRRWRIKYGY